MLDPTALETPETSVPASPPAPSPSSPGVLRSLMDRFRQADREAQAEPETETHEEPEGTATPAQPAAAPASWKPPATPDELQRMVQAEADRRESQRRERQAREEEQQRQRTLVDGEARYEEARARYGDDSLEAATLAAQLHDLRKGIQRDYYDQASQQELLRVATIHAAAETHKAAFSPLLEGLPDPELKKLSSWWMDHAVPDAQGRTKVAPDQALAEMAKQITRTRDEQVRRETIDGIFELVDKDPTLRAQFVAHLYGSADFDEPEHLVGGTAAGLPTDEQLAAMTPQQYQRLHLSKAAEQALLRRPNRR